MSSFDHTAQMSLSNFKLFAILLWNPRDQVSWGLSLSFSHHHGLWEMGKDLWRPFCPTPCSNRATQSGLPRQLLRAPRSRLQLLSGQPVPMLHHSKGILPDVQRECPMFQFVYVASSTITGHQWEEPGSIIALHCVCYCLVRCYCFWVLFTNAGACDFPLESPYCRK